jgi:hypothetical protein
MFQRAQLIVTNAAIVMDLVQLRIRDAEDEIGGATVAGQTFGAAWKTPELRRLPSGMRSSLMTNSSFVSFRSNQVASDWLSFHR